MRPPRFPIVFAKVAFKRLLAPRTLARIRDGRKGGDGLVFARVLEEERQSAVAAHAVAGDADARGIELWVFAEEKARKFVGDVAVHFVALGPWLFRRIDVEAGACAEVVAVVFALDLQASG